jgi:hopene-associated glycosyltransferase HpnB
MDIGLLITGLISTGSLLTWVWLVLGRGWFWRIDQKLDVRPARVAKGLEWSSVSVIIPARNEASILPETLPTLLNQSYPGLFHIFLVDDHSLDNTSEVARKLAQESAATDRLTVVAAEPLPPGWTGKLWALQQGFQASQQISSRFLLLTDADIAHSSHSLTALVSKAQTEGLDLVSVMVQLWIANLWERLLIPAFVFFFAKFYPFRWVGNPGQRTAAAAGGCILLRREALEHAGGFRRIASAIIDDCALAKLIKGEGSPAEGKLWLGLSQDIRSLRPYNGLGGIWDMVARTAFTQLHYSPLLLIATILGLWLVYLVPPLSAAGGLAVVVINPELKLGWWLLATGLLAWMLMAFSYLPMLRWYNTSLWFALFLPLTLLLYTLMTVDSARQYWKGAEGAWKGRTYELQEKSLDGIIWPPLCDDDPASRGSPQGS